MLNQHGAVRESVVIADAGFSSEQSKSGNRKVKSDPADENPQSERRLVAYVVQSQGPTVTVSELRSFLKHRLPEYMIPAAFVFLDVFPLTPNGKIDRNALPPPDQSKRDSGVDFVTPRTLIEETLAEIWSEVLKVERVGIHDNFFDLGGHSLLGYKTHIAGMPGVSDRLALATFI